ncbi:MAG: TOBE domain-containing protein, partial [Propionivibrio sp.]
FNATLVSATAVELPTARARIDLPVPVKGKPGTPVVVGIRPQGLVLAEEANAVLRMQVKLAEYLGTETVLNGSLVGSDEAVTSSVNGDQGKVAGSAVGLTVDPAHVHVFAAKSGLNLVY